MSNVGISVFNDATYARFLESDRKFFGHNTKIHCLKKGDFILLYNNDKKIVYGIGILRAIDKNYIYRERCLLDPDLYTEEYKKYNKYEVGVNTFLFDTPISVLDIMKQCGLPETTQLFKVRPSSFKHVSVDIKSWVEKEFLNMAVKHFSK